MKELDDLRRELDDLRDRLDGYHEHLESSLEHNNEFQLKATWGVVQGISTLIAFCGAGWALERAWRWFFGEAPGWFGGLLIGIGMLAAVVLAASQVERGLADDRKKLHTWPVWNRARR